MDPRQKLDEDAARFKRVLKQIAQITVDEWEAKIAFYEAETAKLEQIEQEMMAAEPVVRSRTNRRPKFGAPATPSDVSHSTRKIKVAK